MYVCKDCGCLFEEPKRYIEKHGLSTPPYEQYNGCPECGCGYAKAYLCDNCGFWITDDYIRVESQRYCQDCYQIFEIGDED